MAAWEKTHDEWGNPVYTLPARTNWAEVAKIYPCLEMDLPSTSTSDDAVLVHADDDEIRFIVITTRCSFTHSHTRSVCGHPACREA